MSLRQDVSPDEDLTASAAGQTRLRHRVELDWRFHLGDVPGAQDPSYDHSGWRCLDLPHDWSIEGEYAEDNPSGRFGGFLPVGTGWYRRFLVVPDSWLDGRRVFIEFDGVYMNSDVWVNGHHLGHRPYGYIGFEYDLTPHLRGGQNVVAVRVDHSRAPSGRWYTGSGIYRHVWLTVTGEVHVGHWGTFVTTPRVTAKRAEVVARVTVCNASRSTRSVRIRSAILGASGATMDTAETQIAVPAKDRREVEQRAAIDAPRLWSPDSPQVYTLRTTVDEAGSLLDEYITPFGVRSFTFDPATGFALNGVPTKLKGVCNHHDAGPVGAAVPDKVLERRLRLLKEMGCNSIRTSTKPAAPEFYDLCDRMGFFVVDDAFDGWATAKASHDYSLYFDKWWRRDLRDLVRRDRNHPCVILWCVGNEVVGKTEERTRELVKFVHKLDPTRPVTCARGTSGIEDVQGFNGEGGVPGALESYHAEHPDRVTLLTEEPHTLQTRGFYRTQTWWRDQGKPRFEIPNLTESEIFFDGSALYNSSYDNSGVRCCARDSWRRTRDLPYVCGEFRWSGFDYLGESPAWPARMYNHGIIDICGFPKDHYFFYQSQWTTQPMVHVLPHWTHPGMEGVLIPVWVYTNCDEVELFLNDESRGTQAVGEQLNLSWLVAYAPGKLRAVGRRHGKQAAVTEVATAGTPSTLRLSADNTNLTADGRDISHVTFEIIDSVGTVVPTADNTAYFWWRGPVRCFGFDNGDPLDLTAHCVDYRRVFQGLGLGIFAATREPGDIELVAGAIVGDRIFAASTQISITVADLMLRGQPARNDYAIYWTTNGLEPTPASPSYQYERPFTITETCTVNAAVYLAGERILTVEQTFTKGTRPKVVDLTHRNQALADLQAPPGPFDSEAVGTWRSVDQTLILRQDGTVLRPAVYGQPQSVGSWWYDFPHDPFEVPDDTGSGEIWWQDGTTSSIRLDSQQATSLYITVDDTQVHFHRIADTTYCRPPSHKTLQENQEVE